MSIIGVGSKFTNGKEVESTEGSQAKVTKALNDVKSWVSSFGISGAVSIPSGTDLNNLTVSGVYASTSGSLMNSPISKACYVIVLNITAESLPTQIINRMYSDDFYVRSRTGTTIDSSWTAWVQQETTTGAQEKVDAHANLKNNPHEVTKAQIGLPDMVNGGLATQAEAQEGTSNEKYMTPLRVKEAIASSSVSVTAGNVPVTDTGNYFTTTNVEDSLQEIGQVLNGARANLIISANKLLGI